MGLDATSLVLIVVLLLAPAIIVFTVLTVIRIRRTKFHRQRITKGKTKPSSSTPAAKKH